MNFFIFIYYVIYKCIKTIPSPVNVYGLFGFFILKMVLDTFIRDNLKYSERYFTS